MDITNRVTSSGNEMGLLGLAFHPNFTNNGYFFVDYTASSPSRTVISRFKILNDTVDTSDELIILEVAQPYSNHNGGQIRFGPDGYLYIALGDGGAGGDPQNNGQDRSTLLGSILRINIDKTTSSTNYDIPTDNPFVNNTSGYKEEIFAYGLRNPWRFSFDNSTLWAGDVGQNSIEEIDIVESGKNYGWNVMEGSNCYNTNTCNDTDLVYPVYEYSHSFGFSITGGFVYRFLK